MYSIKIEDDAIGRALAQLSDDLGDLSEPMNDIGAYMVESTQDRIKAGISPDGTALAPLSQSTLDHYARTGKTSNGPLNQSGDMYKNIYHDYTDSSVSVGSNAIQAAVMQWGAPKGSLGDVSPWGDIPARPYLGISNDDLDAMPGIIEDWIASISDAVD